jgi:hypothetical protein
VAEVMLTIRPQPRAAMPVLTAWASSIGAVTFTANVACHSARGSTPMATFEARAALFTRTSTSPARDTSARTATGSDRSASRTSAVAPRSRQASATRAASPGKAR